MEFENLQSLLPIVVFILWLIFGSRKKKPANNPAPGREPQRPDPSGTERTPQPQRQETGRTSLEDFLENMGVVLNPEKPRASNTAPRRLKPQQHSVKNPKAKKAPRECREGTDHEPRREERKVTKVSAPSYINTRPDNQTPAPSSIDDLRKAVVWSEILGPPVAIRSEHGDPSGVEST